MASSIRCISTSKGLFYNHLYFVSANMSTHNIMICMICTYLVLVRWGLFLHVNGYKPHNICQFRTNETIPISKPPHPPETRACNVDTLQSHNSVKFRTHNFPTFISPSRLKDSLRILKCTFWSDRCRGCQGDAPFAARGIPYFADSVTCFLMQNATSGTFYSTVFCYLL